MGLHKLTAGDGYTYLTRQVAVHDATELGYSSLGDYYAQRGESPGRWMGAGLASLGVSGEVSEAQMRALFGEGRHPDADAIELAAVADGATPTQALQASALGRAFAVYAAQPSRYRQLVAARCAERNTERDLPRDRAVPAEVTARIRTETALELFEEQHRRPPLDRRELAGFIARESRQATTAVAGYDLTFSPVKSVSTLWAIAPRLVATQIEAAHDAAVADTLGWLEREVAFTREGPAGARQVPVRGLLAAAFTHRDSRAGDPDLHTHLAVSNKVQTRDGRWLALDGRVLHKAKVAASEYYNTRLEAHLRDRLGVTFTERADRTEGKRPVREIDEVDPRLAGRWSSRQRDIQARQAVLSAHFQAEHDRPPTPVEAIALAQQANLQTRDPKHEPRSHAEQRTTWRAEAIAELGSLEAVDGMVDRTLNRHRSTGRVPDGGWIETTAAQIVATVEASRATWQVWHVRAEALRLVREHALPVAELDDTVDRLVTAALSRHSIPIGLPDAGPDPEELRRPDGASVYEIAGSRLYTSARILAAEQALVAAAHRRDGHAVDPQTVELALLESAVNGVELTPGQAQVARELACSGARLQLALAPAGTGKTTAVAVLARAWTDAGGTVVGLAPSATAATALRQVLGGHTDTLAKLCHAATIGQLPGWAAEIGPAALVVIDEAGLAGTTQLAQAVAFVLGRGGSVRLVADDQQQAAIGAGGVLRDLAHSAGAVTLSQVVRFTDPAEAAASLAIRAGDPAGLGFYLDQRRVHVGDRTTAVEQAYAAWAADRAAGRTTVMLAPTRQLTAALNARARADRLRRGGPPSREVLLNDGLHASAGDLLLTRRNDRRLPLTPVDFVKNGDRWIVQQVHQSGAVDVRHLALGTRVRLPADYVATACELGYAATIHAAQGITTDTAHTVLTGGETRQLMYVALTRGRAGNHLYLTTAGDGDPHHVIRPDTLRPPTAVDTLTAILARDGAEPSATTQIRDAAAPAVRLRNAVARYSDAVTLAAERHAGAQQLADIDAAAEQIQPGLTGMPAYPTLRASLALLACDGADPIRALEAAADWRELGSAVDPAAVLDWRISQSAPLADGPLPWLPALPRALADDPRWGLYLARRADLIVRLAEQTAVGACGYTPTSSPQWATRLLDHDPALLADVAIWRAANGVPDEDWRPTGSAQQTGTGARHQLRLDQRIAATVGDPHTDEASWAELATKLDPRLHADPYWRRIADRLDAVHRAGIDVAALASAVADQAPLPDEHPAAALWWRLTRHLSPAVLDATDRSPAPSTDPDWTPVLTTLLGAAPAHRVRADPAWPALIAAVAHARHNGWQPDELLEAATAFATDKTGQPVPASDLAEALVWRVTTLVDPEPLDDPWIEATLPPDPQPHPDRARTGDPIERSRRRTRHLITPERVAERSLGDQLASHVDDAKDMITATRRHGAHTPRRRI